MEEEYSIDEILKAVNELQSSNKEKKIDTIVINKPTTNKKLDIPSNTLRLIEEAEKTIKSKLRLK